MTLKRTRILATLLSLLLVASIVVPGAVAGATQTASNDSLQLSLTQDPDTGNATVTLTENDTDEPVPNASVSVLPTDENHTYAGSGDYETGENGSLTLTEPNTTVEVIISAETENNATINGTFELTPRAESLSVAIDQADDGSVTVSVDQYDEPVENASVNVTSEDSYDGAGEYETDENGEVGLPAPTASVNITATATVDDLTEEATAQLDGQGLTVSVDQADDWSVIIEVLDDGEFAAGADVLVEGDYEYAGDHETGENGTVELPAPTNDTTINVTAEYDNETATTSATIQARNDSNPNNDFAQGLVDFIRFLHFGEVEGPPGQAISDFVHEHNPSNADDNAGPPEHAGPPDHAGPDNETENETDDTEWDGGGPPPWAGPPGEDDDDENESDEDAVEEMNETDENETADNETADSDAGEEVEEEDEDEEEEEDDDDSKGSGPPDHAGPPNRAGPR